MGARDLMVDLAVAGVTVTADGDQLVIRPASKLTSDMRAALRAAKPELMILLTRRASSHSEKELTQRRYCLPAADAARCHAGGWSDAEIAVFVSRHARLLAAGLPDGDADELAERLTLRDRDGDDRRLCIECSNFRGSRCRQPGRASIGAEVGALALVLQHCPAFAPAGGESC